MSFQPAQPAEVSNVVVDRVDQKPVRRKDGTNTTLYEVFVVGSVAPLSTFKRDLAESAFSLVGQSAEAHFTVKQNGQFTNYYLEQILPAPASPVEAAQRAQEAQPLLRQAAGLPEPAQALQQAQEAQDEKTRAIHRQVAAKVAATLFTANPSDAPTFWENIRLLALYFDTGIIPGAITSDVDDDIPF